MAGANQFFIVRFAHGLLPALVLTKVVRRRWLFTSGLHLYSRPYVYLQPRTREHVYSRPCAWSGKNAAYCFGNIFSHLPLLLIMPGIRLPEVRGAPRMR